MSYIFGGGADQRAYGATVYRSANQTGMTAGANNKVAMNVEDYDPFGIFDAVTNFRFTPLRAGIYGAELILYGATSNTETIQSQIFKNGGVSEGVQGGYISDPSAAGFSFFSLAAFDVQMNGSTDYLEAFVYLPAGTTSIFGVKYQCRFSAFWKGYAA